jgi:hypothetical protein
MRRFSCVCIRRGNGKSKSYEFGQMLWRNLAWGFLGSSCPLWTIRHLDLVYSLLFSEAVCGSLLNAQTEMIWATWRKSYHHRQVCLAAF